MNYKAINIAILSAQDVSKSITRDSEFYDYLLNNSVAYYYATHLSKEKTDMDKKVIAAGNILNDRFLNTVVLIDKVGRENNIKFMFFKTYKYIPEVVDGDIDLFVQEKDFHKFLNALEKEGFKCFENEPLKGFCKKDGYSIIEPRVNAEFHGLIILNENKIWEKVEYLKIGEIKVLKAFKELDIFYLLLTTIYGPKYLTLYLLILYRDCDIKKLYRLSTDKQINEDLEFLISNLITNKTENKRFPFFMGDIHFALWWCKRILPALQISIFERFKHLTFFFYSKYVYIFFNKLVFKHTWPISNK